MIELSEFNSLEGISSDLGGGGARDAGKVGARYRQAGG